MNEKQLDKLQITLYTLVQLSMLDVYLYIYMYIISSQAKNHWVHSIFTHHSISALDLVQLTIGCEQDVVVVAIIAFVQLVSIEYFAFQWYTPLVCDD